MLYVLVTVTAADVPLSPKPGIYIEGDQIFKGVEAPSPETIDAGTSSPTILAFADAQDVKLDGQVTFDLKLGDAGHRVDRLRPDRAGRLARRRRAAARTPR